MVGTGLFDRSPNAMTTRLRRVRAIRGMSRAQLSERTGVCPASIARYEHGREPVLEIDKAVIAQALGIPFAILWGPSTDVLAAWLERPDATACASSPRSSRLPLGSGAVPARGVVSRCGVAQASRDPAHFGAAIASVRSVRSARR